MSSYEYSVEFQPIDCYNDFMYGVILYVLGAYLLLNVAKNSSCYSLTASASNQTVVVSLYILSLCWQLATEGFLFVGCLGMCV